MEGWSGEEEDRFQDEKGLYEDSVEERGGSFEGGCEAHAIGSNWGSSST